MKYILDIPDGIGECEAAVVSGSEGLCFVNMKKLTAMWIPVSERLPEEADGTVLVCMPNESPYNEREQFINAKHNQQVETAHYSQYSDTWYFAMGAVSETRPIAWMPLPPVYREAEKRENERSNV